MIKKHIKQMILASIIILLPIVAGIILWDQLPDSMPAHWNFDGEVDRWTSKATAVFFYPFLLLAVHWICIIGTSLDPKRKNQPEKVLTLLMWLLPVMSIVLNGSIYAVAMNKDVNIEVIISLLVGVIFTIIGNYLPKCKQNYTIGIKIPWTLDSEENWNRTHRFGGIVWTISGIIIILLSFINAIQLMLPIMLLMVFAPVIYSYMLYKKGI